MKANALLHNHAARQYHKASSTNNYILCFARNKTVWAVEVNDVDSLFIQSISYLEMRSKGWTLRFRPTKAQQDIILSRASRVELICSTTYLETEKVNHNNNRGNTVEDLVTMVWKGTQPDNPNTCFTERGDFNANGTEYQVKYGASTGAATFTTEKIMNNIVTR